VVSKHVDTHLVYQKKSYDRLVRPQKLVVGQAVWLRVFPRSIGRSKALVRPWSPNWVITAKLSEANYRIQRSAGSSGHVVGGNRLKPYLGTLTNAATQRLFDSLQQPAAGS
jgi:hypothetical protein